MITIKFDRFPGRETPFEIEVPDDDLTNEIALALGLPSSIYVFANAEGSINLFNGIKHIGRGKIVTEDDMKALANLQAGHVVTDAVAELIPHADKMQLNRGTVSFVTGRHVFRFTTIMGMGQQIYIHTVDGVKKGKRIIDLDDPASGEAFVEELRQKLTKARSKR